MSSKFRKLVERAADSRYVPLFSPCSLSGKKPGFFRPDSGASMPARLPMGLCVTCVWCRWRGFLPPSMNADMLHQAAWNLFNINHMHRMLLHNGAYCCRSHALWNEWPSLPRKGHRELLRDACRILQRESKRGLECPLRLVNRKADRFACGEGDGPHVFL